MAMTLLPAAGRTPAPWKNHGGVTREVAAHPRAGELTDFAWRISVADVARDGDFSAFPGYHRVITLLEGAGMELTVDGATHRIDRPYRPFVFSGGSATSCRLLDGPVVDFNVMTRAADGPATVEILRVTGPVDLPAAESAAVVVFEGSVDVLGSARHSLGPLDALLLRAEPAAVLRCDRATAVVAVIGLPA
ncbi:HutD family protein [Solihabitans fulvus]|uniref:HutD family protein n=1 Tax=Solihabitans fulvus TaxID=1892852 RepID=A0A5B2WQ67_9PSEU|nr:HutD family protein [Solihabitans fulvus]KAA2253881.1 HutD family protein [Solihabitans fulvus]